MRNTNLIAHYIALPISDARAAWIERCRIESGRVADARDWMVSNGFEVVLDPGGNALMTTDGREILREHGMAWALRPDVHADRLRAAFEDAERAKDAGAPETKSVIGTETLSSMICPKCGDRLQHTNVCPACAAGKIGYRHRYACVCGGVDFVSKEAL